MLYQTEYLMWFALAAVLVANIATDSDYYFIFSEQQDSLVTASLDSHVEPEMIEYNKSPGEGRDG